MYGYCRLEDGVQHGDIKVTYNMIQHDVRNAVNWIHNDVSNGRGQL